MGTRPSGLAHRMLGDGRSASWRNHRHPRRRQRLDVPAPRKRDCAEHLRARRPPVRALLAAQRHAHVQRPQDVEVARQRDAAARALAEASARSAALSVAEGALPAAARLVGYRTRAGARDAGYLVRRVARPRRHRRRCSRKLPPPAQIEAALLDDLNTPEALAGIAELATASRATRLRNNANRQKPRCSAPARCSVCCSRIPKRGSSRVSKRAESASAAGARGRARCARDRRSRSRSATPRARRAISPKPTASATSSPPRASPSRTARRARAGKS